eukprot:1391641-Amphidinium_carterae.1
MRPPSLRTASGEDLAVEGVYVLNDVITAPSGQVLKFTAYVAACHVTKVLFRVGPQTKKIAQKHTCTA